MHCQSQAAGLRPEGCEICAVHRSEAGRLTVFDMDLHADQPLRCSMSQKVGRNHASEAEIQVEGIGMGKQRGSAGPPGKPDGFTWSKRRNPALPVAALCVDSQRQCHAADSRCRSC